MQFQLELKNQHQNLQSKAYFPFRVKSVMNRYIKGENRKLAPANTGIMVAFLIVPGNN